MYKHLITTKSVLGWILSDKNILDNIDYSFLQGLLPRRISSRNPTDLLFDTNYQKWSRVWTAAVGPQPDWREPGPGAGIMLGNWFVWARSALNIWCVTLSHAAPVTPTPPP